MRRLLIMTDSTCDLPSDWVERYDIRVVPTYVQFGQESLADDGVQLTRKDFYRRLINTPIYPTTSAPPLGQTQAMMARALDEAEHVLAITAPAKLSSIYNTFHLAAKTLAPHRVTLIDSTQLSMGLGWQVLTAAEMAEAGAELEAIVAAVRAMQPRTHIWAALDSIQSLRRSGRVSWAAAWLGDFFKIKPIIHLHDSEVHSASRVRTTHRAFDTLIQLTRAAAPFSHLAFLHTSNPEGAQRLSEALADLYPQREIVTAEVTPVIGVHVGAKGLGLAVVRKS